MVSKEVIFHKEALVEYEAALDWYMSRSAPAAAAFSVEVNHAIAVIGAAPERWVKGPLGTRKFVLSQFPFVVWYRELASFVQIVSVSHGYRRPRYWKERL